MGRTKGSPVAARMVEPGCETATAIGRALATVVHASVSAWNWRHAAQPSRQPPVAFQSEAEIPDACARRSASLHTETHSKPIQLSDGQKSAVPGLNLQQWSAVRKAPAAWDSENNLARNKALAGSVWNPTNPSHCAANTEFLDLLHPVHRPQQVGSHLVRAVLACETENRHIHHTTHDKHWNQRTQATPTPLKSRLGNCSNAL